MKYRNDWPSTKRATVLLEEGPTTTVVYHSTPIFSYNRALNVVRLESGGYRTKTTKDRINEAFKHFGLPFRVYQEPFEWFVERFDIKAASIGIVPLPQNGSTSGRSGFQCSRRRALR